MMNLFKTEKDKEIWIRLVAELMIERDKLCFDEKTGLPYSNAIHPRSMKDALEVAKRQCEYDESVGKLRYTLEELLLLNSSELFGIRDKQHKDFINQFNSLK